MNDLAHRFPRSNRKQLRFPIGIVAGSVLILVAGLLRAAVPSIDPIPAAATTGAPPSWVSPITPYDPAEGTAAAHAVQIDASPHAGYVQTSAFAQTGEGPTPAQLPPGGYIWGGSPAGAAPSAGGPPGNYSVVGSVPPPESPVVSGPPPAGNVLGGLGFGVSAPVGVPPLGPLLSDQPILMMPNFSPDAFHTIFRLHQSITDDIGDDGPITSIGGFFPHTTANGLWFIDGQFNLLEDALNPGEETENFGSNLGIGWRRIVPEFDAIAGISFWYDLDRTRPDFVHQAAVSGELLGDVWQLRTNLYFPCGTNRIGTSTALGAPFYIGENIDLPQSRSDNLDMAGTDFEIGRRLPGWLGENGVSAYVGGYYYQADAAFNTFGFMTRIEALLSPNLTIDAKFSSDPLFKNRVGLGVTWLLPTSKCKSCAADTCSEVYRLTEPVVRNRTVVYATQTLNTSQIALNPATGTPIIVVHVDSNAPAGGNGTVNMPYNNLPAAQAGSAPNDIILVQGSSVFTGQSIALQNSQRFLGEGIPHTVDTVQAGVITLPTTSSSTTLPVIQNSPGDAVTLANSNEVSGFTINNSGGEAIAGNGISGTANINNVAINGGLSGISIQNSSAAVTVSNTPIVGAATGITLQNNTGSFDFSGMQTVTGSTATGVLLSGNSSPVTFDNLQLSATTGTGLSATNQTGTLTISAGTITAAAGAGVAIDNSATTAAPLAVTLQSVNSTGGTNGISLNNAAGSFTVAGSGTTPGSGGTISDATGAGVAITGESGSVAINYMNITNPVGDGVDVTNSAAAANVTLTGTQITLSGTQTGVSVANNSGTLNANSVTVTGGGVGLNVGGSSGTENVDSFTATNAATGINLATNTGTFNATGTTTVNGSTSFGVDLSNNSGPVSFGTLNVAATTGTGLSATNQTGTLTIAAGTITASDSTGVNINNSGGAAAPLAVSLTAVNAASGTHGILLNNAGGNFTVTGSGTTPGSGGTISDTTGAGVSITGESGTVALNYMNITNAAADGVDVTTSAAGSSVTLTGMQITQSGNHTGVNVSQNSGAFALNGSTITGGNTGVRVQNSTSTATDNFANLTVNNAASGLLFTNNAGAIDATGTTTVTGSTASGVRGDDNGAPITFDNLQIAATSGTGLESNNQTGTFTISAGSVSNANGVGVNIDGPNAGTPLAVTLQSVSSTNGSFGIELNNAAGSFTVTGTGTTAGSGGTIVNANDQGIQITNEIGTVSLNNMNVTNPNTDGVLIQDPAATSNISLTGMNISGAGGDGVHAQNNLGTLAVTNTTISGAKNGIELDGNHGSVTVSGSSLTGIVAEGIELPSNSGTVAINTTTISGGTIGLDVKTNSGAVSTAGLTVQNSATGISVSNSTSTGTFDATGTTTVTGTTTAGVNLNTDAGAVTFDNLQISATSGFGLEAVKQTGALTISAGSIASASGTGVSIDNSASGTPAANLAVALTSVSSSGGAYGIFLDNTAGSFAVNGTGSTAGSGGTITGSTTEGVSIQNESGTATVSNVKINNSTGDSADVDDSTVGSTVTFNNMQITNPGSAGLGAVANAGTLNYNNVSITGGSNGLLLASNTGTINVANLSVANAANGINAQSDTGAINFTGTTTVTGSTSNGVYLSGNSGAIAFDNLQINATTGTALNVQNQTAAFTISAGSVTAQSGTALNFNNVLSSNVTLGTVNSAGATNGIILSTVGGAFNINGGTVSSSGDGVEIEGSSGITLNNMSISSSNGAAVSIFTSSGITVENSALNATLSEGIFAEDNTGTNTFTGNFIPVATGNFGILELQISPGGAVDYITNGNSMISSASNVVGVGVEDFSSFNNTYQINGNSIDFVGASGTVGFDMERFGSTSSALSGTVNNTVTADTPTEFDTGGGGSFTGTFIVNGTPEP